jgi:small neutral amino acid transporter SnatA (MarC family)
MSTAALVVVFVALVDPAGLAISAAEDRKPLAAARWGLAAAVAAAAAAVVAVFADEVLRALDITSETFRIAAGIVVTASALVHVVAPHAGRAGDAWAALLTPSLLAASLSFGADEGAAVTVMAALTALAVGWLSAAHRPAPWVHVSASRIASALAVAVGIGLAVDGILDV